MDGPGGQGLRGDLFLFISHAMKEDCHAKSFIEIKAPAGGFYLPHGLLPGTASGPAPHYLRRIGAGPSQPAQ